MLLESCLAHVCCATWGVHIRRIQHYTVDCSIFIREVSTINSVKNIGCPKVIILQRHITPNRSLAISNIGHNATFSHIQT